MEALPKATPEIDDAWEQVQKHAGLRGEPKLAWWYLWRLSRRGTCTVYPTALEIGAAQGRGKQTGYRALVALADVGLIEKQEDRDGRWCVYVVHPAEVGRPRRRTSDGQRLIPELERDCQVGSSAEEGSGLGLGQDGAAAESGCEPHPDSDPLVSPDVNHIRTESGCEQHPDSGVFAAENAGFRTLPRLAHAPARAHARLPSIPSVSKISKLPSPSILPSEPSVPSEDGARAQDCAAQNCDAATRSGSEPQTDCQTNWSFSEPRPIGFVLGEANAYSDGLAMRLNARVFEVAGEIRSWANDKRLRATPVLRVARALVDGRLPRDAYEDAKCWYLTQLKAGKLKFPPGAFVGVFKRVFRRNGLEWPEGEQ
jgi:hypothetical protein